MSTFLRHIKQNEKWNTILKILNENFEGNKDFIKEAKNTYNDKYTKLKKLKNTSNILASIAVLKDGPEENKITQVDLNNKNISIFYPIDSPSLLSFNLDYLSARRVFPISISTLINRNISKDRIKMSNSESERDNILKISQFLKNFCSTYNLIVNKIQVDKNSKIIQFETTQRDNTYGTSRQYITITMNKDRKFELDNIKDSIGNLSTNYKSLFSYFSLFGFSDIYARCTCRSYMQKYSRKRGMQNYMCSHILYSMSMLPNYLLTVLAN